MITKDKFEQLMKENLSSDHYWVLREINEGRSPGDSKRVKGLISLLEKKGYLLEGILTEKATDLVREEQQPVPVVDEKGREESFDTWVERLQANLKAKLREHIGKEQVKGFGNVYFIPSNITDLRTFLERFHRKYKLLKKENLEKIEKILLKHVDECARKREFAPAVLYFIIKDGTPSRLAAALESYKEEEQETKPAGGTQTSIGGLYVG